MDADSDGEIFGNVFYKHVDRAHLIGEFCMVGDDP